MHIVTGGAGFIGSNLARMLIEHGGDDVMIVDDLSDGHKFRNIADLNIVDYVDKDDFLGLLRSDASFSREVQSIFHQGACSETTEWDGRYLMRNNFSFSKDVLHYCLRRNIPFIYASSAAVYGASDKFAESPENELPLNVYGYSKLLFDQYVRQLALTGEQQVVGLRYFNVYGPREQHKGSMASVAFHFNNQLQENGELRLFEGSGGFDSGEQLRDFVYVDDVCGVNLWFLQHPEVSGIFNVGTGKPQTFNEVGSAVIDWHDAGRITYIPFPEGLKDSYQSFTRAALGKLRGSGCDVVFRDVANGIKTYLDILSG